MELFHSHLALRIKWDKKEKKDYEKGKERSQEKKDYKKEKERSHYKCVSRQWRGLEPFPTTAGSLILTVFVQRLSIYCVKWCVLTSYLCLGLAPPPPPLLVRHVSGGRTRNRGGEPAAACSCWWWWYSTRGISSPSSSSSSPPPPNNRSRPPLLAGGRVPPLYEGRGGGRPDPPRGNVSEWWPPGRGERRPEPPFLPLRDGGARR